MLRHASGRFVIPLAIYIADTTSSIENAEFVTYSAI